MNYYITRGDQQYGPYTLADLQRYVASGDVQLTDLALSEGMSAPLPVAQIIGTISVQQPAPAIWLPRETAYPDPPNLHWSLVLLFGIFSCGLFIPVWDIVQAAWMRQIEPASTAIYYYVGYAGTLGLIFVLSFLAARQHTASPSIGIVNIAGFVIVIIGRFNLKHSLEQHYNSEEPMALTLSGVMTFFFGAIYFQYHLNDIVRRKKLYRLDSQSI